VNVQGIKTQHDPYEPYLLSQAIKAGGTTQTTRCAVHEAAPGRVEMWRGDDLFGQARPALLAGGNLESNPRSVSTPRSTNRTCRFPASGSRTRHTPLHTKGHPQYTRFTAQGRVAPACTDRALCT